MRRIIVFMIFVLTLGNLAAQWSDPITISDGYAPDFDINPVNGHLHIVSILNGVNYTETDELGNKIGNTVIIPGTAADVEYWYFGATIAVDKSGYPHVCFRVPRGDYKYDLYYTRKTASGWMSTPLLLSSSKTRGYVVRMAVDSQDNVHVLQGYMTGNVVGPITYYRIKNAVVNRTIPDLNSTITYYRVDNRMEMTIDKNDVIHVIAGCPGIPGVGNEGPITYFRSTDRGDSFQTVMDVHNASCIERNGAADIAVDGNGIVHIVYGAKIDAAIGSRPSLRYVRFGNNQKQIDIPITAAGDCIPWGYPEGYDPMHGKNYGLGSVSVSNDGTQVMAAYVTNPSFYSGGVFFRGDLYVIQSNDSGNTWSQRQLLAEDVSDNEGRNVHLIRSYNNNFYVIYPHNLKPKKIKMRYIRNPDTNPPPPPPPPPPPAYSLSFINNTSQVVHDETINLQPHGTCFADINADGLTDLYVTTYDLTDSNDKLFINQGNFQFQQLGSTRGVNDWDGGSHGGCWADLDNDGDYDLINGGTIEQGRKPTYTDIAEPVQLYENNGSGYFTERIDSDIAGTLKKTRGVIAFDKEGDGDLDIWCVAGYLGTDDMPYATSHPDEFYQKDAGSWSYSVSTGGGLVTAPLAQGVTVSDFDNDGDADCFAGNRTGNAFVMRNNGSGSFTAVSDIAVTGLFISTSGGNQSVGVIAEGATLGDIDNDGDFDLFCTEADGLKSHLFLNNTYYPDVAQSGTFFKEGSGWSNLGGYMGAFGDLNNDGWLDLVVSGYGYPFINNGAGILSPALTIPIPTSTVLDPRSVALADLDNDGDLDIGMAGKNASSWTHLFKNELTGSNHYLKIKLVSPQGQAGAFGAKVYVSPAGQGGIYPKRLGNQPQIGLREACGNIGYLGQNDPVLHFGLGANTLVDVTVEFPCGRRAIRRNVAADQLITISTADVRVAVKVFLQGPYDAAAHNMKTDININGYLPTTSPYADSRKVNIVPGSAIVDWVFVKLRRASDLVCVDSVSVLLRNDGKIVADDGITEYIYMNGTSGSGYYIEVNHRNHLSVMSALSATLNDNSSTLYDFSSALSQYYGNEAVLLENGVFGMYAGDLNANNLINSSDYLFVRTEVFNTGYFNGDCNMNGIVNSADYLSIKPNIFKTSNVP